MIESEIVLTIIHVPVEHILNGKTNGEYAGSISENAMYAQASIGNVNLCVCVVNMYIYMNKTIVLLCYFVISGFVEYKLT